MGCVLGERSSPLFLYCMLQWEHEILYGHYDRSLASLYSEPYVCWEHASHMYWGGFFLWIAKLGGDPLHLDDSMEMGVFHE